MEAMVSNWWVCGRVTCWVNPVWWILGLSELLFNAGMPHAYSFVRLP
jgi:hypothetical protein